MKRRLNLEFWGQKNVFGHAFCQRYFHPKEKEIYE
jgi:hypothetical protein